MGYKIWFYILKEISWQLFFKSTLFQPITAATESPRLRSLCCRSPFSHRSSVVIAAAARCRQKRSPISTLLISLHSRWGSQSTGTSSSQLSITPFFIVIWSCPELWANDRSAIKSRVAWTLNLGVLPNIHSQLRSSAAASASPGKAALSSGSTKVEAALRLNSKESEKRWLLQSAISRGRTWPEIHTNRWVPVLYWWASEFRSSSHCRVGSWSSKLVTGEGTLGVALLWTPEHEGRSTVVRAEQSAEYSKVQWW